MAYASIQVHEAVDRAVAHDWSVPEFQRGFVWKPTQVRDLIESLWRKFPVGTLLTWNSRDTDEIVGRVSGDNKTPDNWVVDGQQRTTALCILFGRRPYWWSPAAWQDISARYDVRFDVHAKEEPYFILTSAVIRKMKGNRFIKVSRILGLDTTRQGDLNQLQEIARQIKFEGLCDGMDVMEVFTRLDRVRKIRDEEIVVVSVNNELEDVVEIFGRLNSRGTRVREADIYLGIVAARAPGWVRDHFLPYTERLAVSGYHLSPNLVFAGLTAIGVKRVKYKSVPNSFWDPNNITPAWINMKQAWGRLIKLLREYGITSNSLLPTDNALVTLLVLVDKYPDDSFKPALYWFLQASRFGRYSGATTTSLEEDLRDIAESTTQSEAIERLLVRLRQVLDLSSDDFLRDYSDGRFGRLMLYLLVYSNCALDWDSLACRIGFEDAEVLSGYQPQFHHIFPKKYLEGHFNETSINALGNIAVIGPNINIRISSRDPMDYIIRYDISDQKLKQQFIDRDIISTEIAGYQGWLLKRAQNIADAANDYLENLRGNLGLPPNGSEN